MVRSITSDSKA